MEKHKHNYVVSITKKHLTKEWHFLQCNHEGCSMCEVIEDKI